MMHVQVSLITADPQILAGCIGYLEAEVCPVLETRHGSLGLSLLTAQEGGVAIVESFWATHDAFCLSAETNAQVRGELARRVKRTVTAENYEVPVFEQPAALRSGEVVRLTRVEVKLPGVLDVIEVYGDTAVPRLAESPGFRGALLFAAPARGHLISQTVWRDPAARAAGPNVAGIIRSEVLAEAGCEIRAIEDYSLVFNSARKATVPPS
jgi:hypothetical protein